MRRWLALVFLLVIMSVFGQATSLERDGWNLISVCEDMNKTEIDMSSIKEIQSQDGETIYTGEFAGYSNLETLYAGYGYWVHGNVGVEFNSGHSTNRLAQPLNRTGWNLMAACDDISRDDINMSSLREIQSQDGQTTYTGEFEGYSNLLGLRNGYGYWVNGDTGTLFTSKYGVSILASFEYRVINNRNESVEANDGNYTIKLFSDTNVTANDQSNHVGIGIEINANNPILLNIQETYRGQRIIVAVYDNTGKLVAVSEQVLVDESLPVTVVDVYVDEDPYGNGGGYDPYGNGGGNDPYGNGEGTDPYGNGGGYDPYGNGGGTDPYGNGGGTDPYGNGGGYDPYGNGGGTDPYGNGGGTDPYGNGGGTDPYGNGGGTDPYNDCNYTIITDDSLFIDTPPSNLKWDGASNDVADIARAFNLARSQDTTLIVPLIMPSQEKWDTMDIQAQALYLLNKERYDRGIKPFEGIDANVVNIAQNYVELLYETGRFSHTADNNSPWERLDSVDAINNNKDFFSYAENLYVAAGSSSYTVNPIAKAIYDWIYNDSASNQGHRDFCLANNLNDNSGKNGFEGLVGFGLITGDGYALYDGWKSTIIVMNVFDPSDTWNHNNTIYGEQFNCHGTDPYGNGGGIDPYGNGGGTDPYGNGGGTDPYGNGGGTDPYGNGGGTDPYGNGGGTDPYGNGGGTDPYGNDNNSTPFTASDALIEDQWYLNNTGIAPDTWGQYKDLTQGADMRVFGAWNQGVSGAGVVVTISDDGVDFTHPDLASQEEGSTSLQTLATAAVHSDDHGTGCAGIIAARADTDGVVGIAPNAKLIAHKILGNYALGNESTYSKMLNDNISQVSNHSYGPYDDGVLYPQYSYAYDDIKNLVTQSNAGKGHVLLFAAGNGRAYVPRDYLPSEISARYASYDASITVKKSYGDYAGLDMSQQNPYVISVSGFDANNKEVSYAEAGPAVLVAGATGNQAPGAQGFNKPEGATKLPSAAMATTGRNGVSYAASTDTPRDGIGGVDEPVGFNMGFNGTSAATPSVTGVVALIRSANPELTWRDVRWILAKTARKIEVGQNITNQATGQPSTGTFAKPIWSDSGNAEFGKYSHYFGYGAADASSAVSLAKDSNYTLLPPMQECDVNITDNVVTIPVGCPSNIEFVQVKFTATSGLKINDSTFTMMHNNNPAKVISLIVPTTCTAEGGCDISENTVAKTGTVGFMGDTLNSADTFNFTISNSNASNTGDILAQEIKVFGFN